MTTNPGILAMTIRDYLAGMAMQGILSADQTTRNDKNDKNLARDAYALADAMLKERES